LQTTELYRKTVFFSLLLPHFSPKDSISFRKLVRYQPYAKMGFAFPDLCCKYSHYLWLEKPRAWG